MPSQTLIDRVRNTTAKDPNTVQWRTSRYHPDPNYRAKMPEWYLDEIQRLSQKYRPVRWLPLDLPRFEIDMEKFYEIWDREKIDTLRMQPDPAEPWTKEAHPLGKASNWYNAQFKGLHIYHISPENFQEDKGETAWCGKLYDKDPFFKPLIEQIMDTMPFSVIAKLYIWESTREVFPHRDSEYFWDLPNMFRIMLNDENDKPTLYVSDVDHGDTNFVDLPLDTNSFCWSNGSQLHGSDFYGKRKQLVCINGGFDIKKYETLLDRSIEKYRNALNYNLEM